MIRQRERSNLGLKNFGFKPELIASKKLEYQQLQPKHSELTRYDQLKRTAEQLIKSQLTTKTEHDITVCHLNIEII